MTLSSGSNSVVECDLAKVEVAGSNPVSRSILPFPHRTSSLSWWWTASHVPPRLVHSVEASIRDANGR